MEVEIGNVVSSVRAVDTDSLLEPQTMERIVRAVLQALNEREDHRKRVRDERRITKGVSYEREEEER
jgi:hypothetical protein